MDLRASTEKTIEHPKPRSAIKNWFFFPLTLVSFIFYIIVLLRSSLYKIGIFKKL